MLHLPQPGSNDEDIKNSLQVLTTHNSSEWDIWERLVFNTSNEEPSLMDRDAEMPDARGGRGITRSLMNEAAASGSQQPAPPTPNIELLAQFAASANQLQSAQQQYDALSASLGLAGHYKPPPPTPAELTYNALFGHASAAPNHPGSHGQHEAMGPPASLPPFSMIWPQGPSEGGLDQLAQSPYIPPPQPFNAAMFGGASMLPPPTSPGIDTSSPLARALRSRCASSAAATQSQASLVSPGDDLNDVEDDADRSEDKRKRNTQASARFRTKKKQRTLNLERTVSDLTGRADDLEREAANLRRENGWLKEIVMMKGSQRRAEQSTQWAMPPQHPPGYQESSADESDGGGSGKRKGKAKQR